MDCRKAGLEKEWGALAAAFIVEMGKKREERKFILWSALSHALSFSSNLSERRPLKVFPETCPENRGDRPKTQAQADIAPAPQGDAV